MASLKQVAGEPISLAEKLKINAEKLRLAGIGLVSIVEAERTRLYKQAINMGESYGGPDTWVGQITLVGTGTFNLLREESQKLFDELVAEGEAALSKDKSPVMQGAEKIVQSRPVAKSRAAPAVVAKRKNVVTMTLENSSLPPTLQVRLKQAQRRMAEFSTVEQEDKFTLEALMLQALEGDVKGRRPAQSKVNACRVYDIRKSLKGMIAEEAVLRFEAIVEELSRIPEV